MYGLVNKAMEELIVGRYGSERWELIKQRAAVDVDVFISNQSYPDDVTYRLVSAASEILDLPAPRILEEFGEHWVLHTGRQGYGNLLAAGGRSLAEFLYNLPDLHTRVAMIFPDLEPPHFTVIEVAPGRLRLQYRTHRAGLAPFVIGLLHGLGQLYKTPIEVAQTVHRAPGTQCDEFVVAWTDAPGA
jgi:hypothetical protein